MDTIDESATEGTYQIATNNYGPIVPPYNTLPNAVAIIDGTEIFIQKPSNLATQ